MTLFVNGSVIGFPLGSSVSIRVSNDRIFDVGSLTPLLDEEIVDLSGNVLSPGFIDVQCNGALGIDLASEPERLWEFAALLPRWGVTSVLPTFITAPNLVVDRAIATCTDHSQRRRGSARVLGLHLEGPFINPTMSGAHPKQWIQPPNPSAISLWKPSVVSMVTIAPEMDGALEAIRDLADRGIVVSIGHSSATAEEVERAVDHGASAVTHLFNAMSPLHHREPGVAGSAMSDDRLHVSLICDGVHVDRRVVKIVWATLGNRLVLISDAVSALGISPGEMKLGDTLLKVGRNDVRLANGTLAGSVLSMNAAVQNLVVFTGCSLTEAIAAATSSPAAMLRRHDIGTIRVGAYADFVELTPSGSVIATWVGGREVYRSEGSAS
jgi:N-acetylglucosamine-6-phosphate deacetylase